MLSYNKILVALGINFKLWLAVLEYPITCKNQLLLFSGLINQSLCAKLEVIQGKQKKAIQTKNSQYTFRLAWDCLHGYIQASTILYFIQD